MNYYEGMYILDPSLPDEKLEELINSITGEIAEKGEILGIDRLGKKQLAYSVKRITEGQYVVIYFSSDPSEITKLESRYSLNASILRVMILRRKEEEIRKIQEKLSMKSEAEEVAPMPKAPVSAGVEKLSEKAPASEDTEMPAEETPSAEESVASDTEVEKTD